MLQRSAFVRAAHDPSSTKIFQPKSNPTNLYLLLIRLAPTVQNFSPSLVLGHCTIDRSNTVSTHEVQELTWNFCQHLCCQCVNTTVHKPFMSSNNTQTRNTHIKKCLLPVERDKLDNISANCFPSTADQWSCIKIFRSASKHHNTIHNLLFPSPSNSTIAPKSPSPTPTMIMLKG